MHSCLLIFFQSDVVIQLAYWFTGWQVEYVAQLNSCRKSLIVQHISAVTFAKVNRLVAKRLLLSIGARVS